MVDNINIELLLQIEERIVVPTVYLLCIAIIYIVNVMIDSLLIKKYSLLQNNKDIIYMSNVIVLPIQFLFLYMGFGLLFYTYKISLIYIPVIIISSLICSVIKNFVIRKYVDIQLFKKIFFTNIFSTLIWISICSVTIVLLAYYNL